MIKEFLCNICDMLSIPIPAISFDTSHFLTNTTLAQLDPSGTIIYLKKCDGINPDQLFAVAHELRHIWQTKNNNPLYFSSYKPIELCSSIEEYNVQIAELDANAFAGLVMINLFHLKPLFKGLPDSVKEKISEQMELLKFTDIFRET